MDSKKIWAGLIAILTGITVATVTTKATSILNDVVSGGGVSKAVERNLKVTFKGYILFENKYWTLYLIEGNDIGYTIEVDDVNSRSLTNVNLEYCSVKGDKLFTATNKGYVLVKVSCQYSEKYSDGSSASFILTDFGARFISTPTKSMEVDGIPGTNNMAVRGVAVWVQRNDTGFTFFTRSAINPLTGLEMAIDEMQFSYDGLSIVAANTVGLVKKSEVSYSTPRSMEPIFSKLDAIFTIRDVFRAKGLTLFAEDVDGMIAIDREKIGIEYPSFTVEGAIIEPLYMDWFDVEVTSSVSEEVKAIVIGMLTAYRNSNCQFVVQTDGLQGGATVWSPYAPDFRITVAAQHDYKTGSNGGTYYNNDYRTVLSNATIYDQVSAAITQVQNSKFSLLVTKKIRNADTTIFGKLIDISTDFIVASRS